MGESNTVRLESHQWEAVDEMETDGLADNRSEAVRLALNVGLSELGYAVRQEQSRLERAGNLVGWACGFIALAWLGVTLAYPVELRLPAVAALLASLTGFGIARAASAGSVRDWLGGVVGGGSA